MSIISRRTFLKTIGIGVLSAAAVSVLAGCTGTGGSNTGTSTSLLTGQPGTTYTLNSNISVAAVSSTGTSLQDLELSLGTPGSRWADVYEAAYVREAKRNEGVEKFSDLTDLQKEDAEAAAERAVANMPDETAVLYFNVTNYTENELLIAAGNSSTADCVFTANCEGSWIHCTVDPAIVTQSNVTTKITCTVEVPANSWSFKVFVTAPDAVNTVEYTFINTAYRDPSGIDPSKFDFS